MKFVYDGDYKVVDGVTFMFKNPTEVENKRTIERLLKDPSFSKHDGDFPFERIPGGFIELSEKLYVLGHTCPKCGKEFRRGMTMHVRFCKGKP